MECGDLSIRRQRSEASILAFGCGVRSSYMSPELASWSYVGPELASSSYVGG